MESKISYTHSKSTLIDDSPKEDVGVVSEESLNGLRPDLKKGSVDEDGGCRISEGNDEFDIATVGKKAVDSEVVRSPSPEKSWKMPLLLLPFLLPLPPILLVD